MSIAVAFRSTNQGVSLTRTRAGTGAGRLAAVVVTYNRLDQLKVTLSRLLESPAAELAALVVVDNASSDGTADWLAAQTDPRLDVIRSATNRGGAGGFEAGMRRAMVAHDPDWVVVMDDDARPAPGGLATFHELGAGGALTGWDAVAAAVYFPDGDICEMNRPARNPRKHWGSFHLGPADYGSDQPVQVDIASFVGFFVSRPTIERIGYPDPALFIYGDDGIYTLGLSLGGGRIAFQPSVRFEHDCSTFAGSPRDFAASWKVYYYYRNLIFLYRMILGPVLFWPALLVLVPRWALRGLRGAPAGRRAYFGKLALAVRDGVAGRRRARATKAGEHVL